MFQKIKLNIDFSKVGMDLGIVKTFYNNSLFNPVRSNCLPYFGFFKSVRLNMYGYYNNLRLKLNQDL